MTLETGGGITITFVFIYPGRFLMGEVDERYSLGDQHEVTISNPFYIGATEVTQAQFEAVMGINPSTFKDATNPVEMVSWNDAMEFCAKLSRRTKQTVRLPTEAEWEYACRAGSKTAFSFGDADEGLGEYAWYIANSDLKTHPVALKKPNAWGLYDMHGNVLEWCADWYTGLYPNEAVTDPRGPVSGMGRVLRGGACDLDAGFCRSACQGESADPNYLRYNMGFRVVVNVWLNVGAPGP
jgi:formylglycine-generating enzyme required for sulfatase activity